MEETKTHRTSNLVLIVMLAAIGLTTPVRISAQITPDRTTTVSVQLTREDHDRANQMRAGILLKNRSLETVKEAASNLPRKHQDIQTR
jgi:hypothetical protein